MQPVTGQEVGNKIDDNIQCPTANLKKGAHESSDSQNRHTEQKNVSLFL